LIDEESALVPWRNDLRRRVKHYGYKYDYKTREISQDDKLADLPAWAQRIGKRLTMNGYFSSPPDQMIINEYLPGQGISAHVDRDTCFGDSVASISLGSDIVMDFSSLDSQETGQILLPSRSAIILAGAARFRYTHGIAARKRDILAGISLTRARRVSLTFRTVILRKHIGFV
jgi:alkylated DNA repair dioxygenase AlkB